MMPYTYPPKILSLEEAMEFIEVDELLEITLIIYESVRKLLILTKEIVSEK